MLLPPVDPMLASPLGSTIPEGEVAYEPKWDGFRAIVFRTEDSVILQGRGRSASGSDIVDLAYAFPELVDEITRQVPAGTVLDSEIVVIVDGRLDFAALSSRLRPRSETGGANIARLSRELPATLLAFDALWSTGDLMHLPYTTRRAHLEDLAAGWEPPVRLTPSTRDPATAKVWFDGFESAGVDGLIVKPLDRPYEPGRRSQGKVKHQRTADVVVAGWRAHSKAAPDGTPVVGSLLLGLNDSERLHYVGAASAFSAAMRRELVDLLEPLRTYDTDHPWLGDTTSRIPGEANRWRKEQAWIAVEPTLVAEVTYDQMEGHRFRHPAGFARWRPDRDPTSCTFEQLEVPPAAVISELLR